VGRKGVRGDPGGSPLDTRTDILAMVKNTCLAEACRGNIVAMGKSDKGKGWRGSQEDLVFDSLSGY